jgi:hypothetical protein
MELINFLEVKSEVETRGGNEGTEHLHWILSKAIREQQPPRILKELISYNDHRYEYSEQRVCWEKEIGAYGSHEAFFLGADHNRNDIFPYVYVVVEAATLEGDERLDLVVSWILNTGRVKEALENVHFIDLNKIDPVARVVITNLLMYIKKNGLPVTEKIIDRRIAECA